jgi:hypothetical protein
VESTLCKRPVQGVDAHIMHGTWNSAAANFIVDWEKDTHMDMKKIEE